MNRNLYFEDIEKVAKSNIEWDKLENTNILISGSTGLIGRFMIDVILYKNRIDNLNCNIFALGRSVDKLKNIFSRYTKDKYLKFIEWDIIAQPNNKDLDDRTFDFIFHLASNTHPLAYAEDPIGTITANIIGTQNLLEISSKSLNSRFIFASSNEIYGENRGDIERFHEKYTGYIDSNTLRAGYPESKRAGEALCQAYKKQKELDVVIARLTRSYGPTMDVNDSKVISQFIKNSLNNENIVLKSDGTQEFSFTYVADAVYGLLFIATKGENGEAYNIAFDKSNITLKELAEEIARISNTEVIFSLPNNDEKLGFSLVKKALLDETKLKKLGWEPSYDIKKGISRTIKILKHGE